MKTTTLYLLAGVSAIIAALLFSIVQFIHPADAIEAVGSSQWAIAHTLTFLFPIFALLGVTGLYLRQAKESGKLGFIAYLLLFGAFILMLCFGFYEAFVAPAAVNEAPAFVASVLSILENQPGPGALGELYQANGLLYLLGGLLFAIATMRAKVYPRYASIILGVGVLVTLSAAALPFMARPSAVVFSLGFGLLGYGLIRLSRKK